MSLFRPLWLLAAALGLARMAAADDEPTRPHVVFIAVDDLNDCIGPLGTSPRAQTPNLDRLARRGTTFLNAHCQAPLCNPSRAAVLTGLRPTTTGIYGLQPGFRTVPALRDRPTVLQYFHTHGYRTLNGGKVEHHHFAGSPNRAAEADEFGPPGGPGDILPATKLVGRTPNSNDAWVDWGRPAPRRG